jgi:hypothetical protein
VSADDADRAVAATVRWLEAAVIGLNLCPFAKAPHVKRRIRYVVSEAGTEEALLETLTLELDRLAAADPELIETTLLIHPRVLSDFIDYRFFLPRVDALLRRAGHEGTLQVASFHPDYVFAGSDDDDAANNTNRSPYPMLHLLRESSIEQALQHYPDPDSIPAANIKRARQLGLARLQAQLLACHQPQ